MNYGAGLTSSSSVVTPGDGSKTFLSCGVPNLETSDIVVEKVLVIIKRISNWTLSFAGIETRT